MARDRNCATASCACPAQLGITLRRHWTRGMPFLYPRGWGKPPCAARGTAGRAVDFWLYGMEALANE
jgi:hypothetical protein